MYTCRSSQGGVSGNAWAGQVSGNVSGWEVMTKATRYDDAPFVVSHPCRYCPTTVSARATEVGCASISLFNTRVSGDVSGWMSMTKAYAVHLRNTQVKNPGRHAILPLHCHCDSGVN